MKYYDYIFAGGGLSGTLLLYLFLQSPLKNKKFLLIDKNLYNRTSRQWSFWLKEKTPFDAIVMKQWRKFGVCTSEEMRELDLRRYVISLLKSEAYYTFIEKEFARFSNVDCIEAEVLKIENISQKAEVITSTDTYSAEFVFDSTFTPSQKQTNQPLSIQGLDGLVTATKNVFDPSIMTFLDFRGGLEKELFFFYCLPITQKTAYIETSHITTPAKERKHNEHEVLLQTYIKNYLRVTDFSIKHTKFEKIELTNSTVNRRVGKRVIAIGAKAGLIKPTTSYGFANIFSDSKLIVDSFLRTGKPQLFHTRSRINAFIDSAMLELMESSPIAVKQMYKELFNNVTGNGDSVLAYLSDESSFLDSMQLLKNVNPSPLADVIRKRMMRTKLNYSFKDTPST